MELDCTGSAPMDDEMGSAAADAAKNTSTTKRSFIVMSLCYVQTNGYGPTSLVEVASPAAITSGRCGRRCTRFRFVHHRVACRALCCHAALALHHHTRADMNLLVFFKRSQIWPDLMSRYATKNKHPVRLAVECVSKLMMRNGLGSSTLLQSRSTRLVGTLLCSSL